MLAKPSGKTNRWQDDTRARLHLWPLLKTKKTARPYRVWLCLRIKLQLRRSYWPIELATEENTLFELDPINRMVPTTNTRMTANITAYSAMSWPSSSDHNLRKVLVFIPSPF
jgi:hypothetical protein